jgi:hypothetical protein
MGTRLPTSQQLQRPPITRHICARIPDSYARCARCTQPPCHRSASSISCAARVPRAVRTTAHLGRPRALGRPQRRPLPAHRTVPSLANPRHHRAPRRAANDRFRALSEIRFRSRLREAPFRWKGALPVRQLPARPRPHESQRTKPRSGKSACARCCGVVPRGDERASLGGAGKRGWKRTSPCAERV